MTPSQIEEVFRTRVSSEVRIEKTGADRYRVLTPFRFDDGDHLSIYLRRAGDRWVLTDEGFTYMHLSYAVDIDDLARGTRQKVISNALASYSVSDCDGELILHVTADEYGHALYDFAQALLRISDVTILTHERARSTFLADFRTLLNGMVAPNRLAFDWKDPVHDREGIYTVDCRVNGLAVPLFVFALGGDARVQDATIALLQFERWGLRFNSVGLFDEQEAIGRKPLARFSNVCGRQFSSLPAARDRFGAYFAGLQ